MTLRWANIAPSKGIRVQEIPRLNSKGVEVSRPVWVLWMLCMVDWCWRESEVVVLVVQLILTPWSFQPTKAHHVFAFVQSHPLPQIPASNPEPSGFDSEPSDLDSNMMVV